MTNTLDYEIVCLNNNLNDELLTFNIKVFNRWYNALFKNGNIISVVKNLDEDKCKDVFKDTLDFWYINDETIDAINEIGLKWFNQNKKYFRSGYFIKEEDSLLIAKVTKEKNMLWYLVDLINTDADELMHYIIKEYLRKVEFGLVNMQQIFTMIDFIIKVNLEEIKDTGVIDRNKLQENDKLTYIKKFILLEYFNNI